MPLLPREPDIYPANLLEPGENSPEPGRKWLAFYTLARREKDLARRLAALRVPFYAPLVKRRVKSPGGRTRESFVPLFPGYVFARVDDDQRRLTLATNTIARWLPVGDETVLLDDLRSIKRLIDAGVPLTPEARLETGHRVRVRSGPFLGLEGTVVERRGRQRLLVTVRFLNQGVSIELEDVELEPR